MRDLTVYDSQGELLATEGRGQVNERIKDFFFSGVRIALETVGNGYKLTAFFRARDSSANRSEQYYGVLETADTSELSSFEEIIESHLHSEYGKELVTTKEDTTVFEELSGGGLRSPPGGTGTRENIADLVNGGERALVGVGSYEDATTLLTSYLGQVSNPKIVIAENAQSSTLSDYGLVIEKGSYTGLELLGDTEERIEDMKERKRREREQMLGGGPGGMDPYGTQQQSGRFGLGTRTLALAAVGGVALLLVLVSVGACFAGFSVPVAGGLLPMDCGGGGGGGGDGGPTGPAINITNAAVLNNSGPLVHVQATLREDGSVLNGSTLNGSQTKITYNVSDNGTRITADTVPLKISDDGTFELNVSESIENKSYNVTVKWRGASDKQTVTPDGVTLQDDGQTTDGTTTDGQTSNQLSETASFNITSVSLANSTVTAGENIDGTIVVQNDGNASGEVTLNVSASFSETTVRDTIDPGMTKRPGFVLPTDNVTPGEYDVTVTVAGESESASTTVEIQ